MGLSTILNKKTILSVISDQRGGKIGEIISRLSFH